MQRSKQFLAVPYKSPYGANKAVHATAHGVKNVAEDIAHGAKKVVNGAEDVAEDVAHGIAKGMKNVAAGDFDLFTIGGQYDKINRSNIISVFLGR